MISSVSGIDTMRNCQDYVSPVLVSLNQMRFTRYNFVESHCIHLSTPNVLQASFVWVLWTFAVSNCLYACVCVFVCICLYVCNTGHSSRFLLINSQSVYSPPPPSCSFLSYIRMCHITHSNVPCTHMVESCQTPACGMPRTYQCVILHNEYLLALFRPPPLPLSFSFYLCIYVHKQSHKYI